MPLDAGTQLMPETTRIAWVGLVTALLAAAGEQEPPPTYHVLAGYRFFDSLVARIGNREHVVIRETDDLCLALADQRDYDGDGTRDALVSHRVDCAGVGVLFFVSGSDGFQRSNSFPGYQPTIEPWEGHWSVVTGAGRYVQRGGRAIRVEAGG